MKRSLFGIDAFWADKTMDVPLTMMSPGQRQAMIGEPFISYGGKQYPADQIARTEKYLRDNGFANPTMREVLEYIAAKGGAK